MPWGRKQVGSVKESNSRINIWDGAVRSGKTVASYHRWARYVFAYEDAAPLIMAGKTNRTLERNIIQPMIRDTGDPGAKYFKGSQIFELYGRKIECVGANDERAEEKIRGLTAGGAYGDEVTLWPQSFFKMLMSRLSVPGSKFFGTTNPDGPYHWLLTDYLERTGLDLRRFRFTLDDNAQNLDPAYLAAIKKEYTGLWYKRFILGMWCQAEGVVYDAFDEEKHVAEAKEPGRFRFAAIDYGTTNPCVFGMFAHNGKLPANLIREYYHDSKKTGRQKTDAEYADDFKAFCGRDKPSQVYVDPSAASFIAELRKRGVNVVHAKNDVLDGIRFVSGCLTSGSFTVSPECKETIREFQAYVWDEKAQAKGEDKPIKRDDHCMDMIRYGLFSHFFRRYPVLIAGFNRK